MYQSPAIAPAPARPRPRVESIMGYDGVERRTLPLRPVADASITTSMIFAWLRRFWYLVVVLAVAGSVVGLSAGSLIKPRFTSSSDLLLDPTNLQVMADDIYAQNIQGEAQLLFVESKMRVLTSTNVLARVVRSLNLQDDPDLMEPEFPLMASMFPAEDGGQDRFTQAVRALGERVKVRREERSYVVTASVWARTPERAALLTDALVQAFVAELAKSESEVAITASNELNARLSQLRDDAAAADAAIANYRRGHGLPAVGTGPGAEQLSTQSAVQLNEQIATAREALIAAEARYANLTEGSGEGAINAAAQESTVLAGLARAVCNSAPASPSPWHLRSVHFIPPWSPPDQRLRRSKARSIVRLAASCKLRAASSTGPALFSLNLPGLRPSNWGKCSAMTMRKSNCVSLSALPHQGLPSTRRI